MYFKDYYEILEIDSAASLEMIEKSYFTLKRRFNPENFETSSEKAKAIKVLLLLDEAYSILVNERTRKGYDSYRNKYYHSREARVSGSAIPNISSQELEIIIKENIKKAFADERRRNAPPTEEEIAAAWEEVGVVISDRYYGKMFYNPMLQKYISINSVKKTTYNISPEEKEELLLSGEFFYKDGWVYICPECQTKYHPNFKHCPACSRKFFNKQKDWTENPIDLNHFNI